MINHRSLGLGLTGTDPMEDQPDRVEHYTGRSLVTGSCEISQQFSVFRALAMTIRSHLPGHIQSLPGIIRLDVQ